MTLLSNSHIHVLSTTTDIHHMKTSIIKTTSSVFSTTVKLNTYTNNKDNKLIEVLIPVLSTILLIVILYITYFLCDKWKLIRKKENYEVPIPMTNLFSFKGVHDDDDDDDDDDEI